MKSPPVYSGGYRISGGAYNSVLTPKPDWSIITHTSGTHAGKIELRTNMFLRKGSLAGNEPYYDSFTSFVEFVDPTDTEGGTCGVGDCGVYLYSSGGSCTGSALSPDS